MTSAPVIAPRTAARAAYLAAALNLVSALAMVLLLRPGLPAPNSAIDERLVYITSHLSLWRAGWLSWNAAAIALLAFYIGLAGQFGRAAPLRCRLAVICAAAGLAADMSAEALYMGVAVGSGAGALAIAERVVAILSGYVGNGLYTVAGMLLVWAGAESLPRPLLALSIPVWAAGLALSACSLMGSVIGQTLSTAALMPLFVLWAALIGRWLASRAS